MDRHCLFHNISIRILVCIFKEKGEKVKIMKNDDLLERLKRSGRKKPMSMLEKLTEHYNIMGNIPGAHGFVWGHVVGFYKDIDENVHEVYEFPQGKFTIRIINKDFYYYNFDRHDKD